MPKLAEKLITIESESEFKLKEKGSTFLALSVPMEEEKQALSFLGSIRKKYYDATHHCYSYRFADGTSKYSDDGEPGGTAGKRILNAQSHFELTNLLTVVIRYYGGVKLGVGPLGKAYYESAFGSLNSAKIEERILHEKIEIRYKFENSSLVHHLISRYSVVITVTDFEPEPAIKGLILSSAGDHFAAEIISSSNNQIQVKRLNEYAYLRKFKN